MMRSFLLLAVLTACLVAQAWAIAGGNPHGGVLGANDAAAAGGGSLARRSGRTKGTATWFTQDNTEGACGRGKVKDSALVVALSPGEYAKGKKCGRKIRIKVSNGRSFVAKVNDLCPSCKKGHVDLSVGAWKRTGLKKSVGVAKISYTID